MKPLLGVFRPAASASDEGIHGPAGGLRSRSLWSAIFPGGIAYGRSPRAGAGEDEASSRNQRPLRSLEYRAYLIVLCGGALAAALAWIATLAQPGGSAFDRTAYPLMTLMCVALAVLLWRGKTTTLRFVGPVSYVGSVAYLLAKTYRILYEGDGGLSEIASWSPVLVFAAFLIFGKRGGLLWASLSYAALAAVVVPSALPSWGGVAEANLVAQLLIANLVLIVLMSGLARLAEDHVRALASEEAQERLAHTDFLTGISNRRRLYEDLVEEVREASRYGRPLSVILFDLDRFKQLNDSLGHEAGDRVLKEVVRLVGGSLRETDRLGRWGGEEFLVLAPETDLERIRRLAARLRHVVASHRFEEKDSVTASFGAAAHRKGDTPESLLRRADEALYRAKESGRNRVEAA